MIKSKTVGRAGRCAAVLLIFVMLVFTGCGKDDEPDAVTVDFEEDTVVTVGTERVSLAEWYLYSLPKVSAAQSMYGSDIWKYRISEDTGTVADAVKQDILDQIIYIKIVCSKADSLNISLNEDELSDIETQTITYMGVLTKEQKEKYGITEDIVRKVYCDNVLAMKVYENLTLNIDTNIPDEEVRHEIVEYICANKYYENEEDELERYSDAELSDIKARLEELYERAVSDENITKLSQLENEQYAAIEMIAGYAQLKEKFSEELADKVFAMRENEILGVLDTDDAYFIFDCVKYNDEDSTNAERVAIIEQRQRDLFGQEYAKWEAETVTKLNYQVWDNIDIIEAVR